MPGLAARPALGAAAAATAVVYTGVFDPADEAWFPVCIVRAGTGALCPGCGMTRAVHHLVHGDVITAVRFNPLVVPLAIAVVALVVLWARAHARGERVRLAVQPVVVVAVAAAIVSFGVVRNLADLGFPGGA